MQTEHFVTIIDSLFLPQVLALHASLERHCARFTLWILCVDDAAHEVLRQLGPTGVELLRVAHFETPRLLELKSSRTRAEYCWTLTPQAPRFVLDAAPAARRVTYIDADLWFLASPAPLFRQLEQADRSVLITEHAYSTECDQSALSGRFCVQFICFVRGERSEPVRTWWEERCLEWCHARYEDGRFGDQKYLDDWPERFPGDVHVLDDPGLALAPWNVMRFPHGRAIFFHFHSLRLLRADKVLLAGGYQLPRVVREEIYRPYLHDFAVAVTRLREAGWDAPEQDRRAAWQRIVYNTSLAVLRGWDDPLGQGKIARLPLATRLGG